VIASTTQRPTPVHAKIVLGDDRPGEQAAHLQADDRHDRQPGVAHDVPVVNPSFGQALGPGRPDVVLVGHVQDRCAGDAGDDRQRDRAERDRRQDQVLDRVEEELRAGPRPGCR